MKEEKIIPVLLGADLNAYSVALSFHLEFGAKSIAYARYRCGAVEYSRFVKTNIIEDIENKDYLVSELEELASHNKDSELFLIPCTDNYVVLLQSIRKRLDGKYNIHMPDKTMQRRLSDKSDFYLMAEGAGIAYPTYTKIESPFDINSEELDKVSYPAVIKPTSSAEYWEHPFSDMQKVYFPEDKYEAGEIMHRIFSSGYPKSIILQERITGKERISVLTTVSDKNGKVVRGVLGDVILEERGRTSYGNHGAIITKPLTDTARELIAFLENIGYVGIANFDIISDGKCEYVLEINTRQGRSCDYLRAAGVSISRLLVDFARGNKVEPRFDYPEIYWRGVPHKTVMKYASVEDRARAETLYKNGRAYSPYTDARDGALAKAYSVVHGVRLGKRLGKDLEVTL